MPSVDPYAVDVVGRLWPARRPPRGTLRPAGASSDGQSWWVLPSARRARLLVPTGLPAAATMLVRHGDGARRVVRAVTAAGVRSRVAATLPLPRLISDGGGPLQELLERVLGSSVTCGVLLGPPRPNRKPVLQVFARDGSTLAFVKVGTDEATRALVRRETLCLTDVQAAGLRLVQPPGILHAGDVDDLEVLVLEPLASSQQAGRTAFPPPPADAMAELAGCCGTTREALRRSAFWRRSVRGQLDGVKHPATRDRLAALADRIEVAYGDAPVTTGSWHGDWAPWNTGRSTGRVQLWDWERFDRQALWGLDLLHYLAQRVRHDTAQRAAQEDELLAVWPQALQRSAGGVGQDASAVLLAYLPALAARFTAGEHATAGEHPRALWACELAERVLGSPAASGAR